MTKTFDVMLEGCRPEPLASYLKALGVLRVVSEQKDPGARGFWRGEHFVLRSELDAPSLSKFFLEEWRPTPVISPWNGGSGFWPKDNDAAANSILESENPRLGVYATTIQIGRDFIAKKGWTERPADEAKHEMLNSMRALLPDEALAWLDAAVVVGDERPLFPPLLGTGGNDGRLDFSNNYQQRVIEVLNHGHANALEGALFGSTFTTRFQGTMGQYMPAAGERTNPWDFVLLIEGTPLFAASASRRYRALGGPPSLAFPFHAFAAGGVGTLAGSDEGESRNELWLPLWSDPASLRALRKLFAEGRATVGSSGPARSATSALDFARALSSLGVDRGVESFSRIGFHVRNGLAYYATPLGRYEVGEIRAARLLDEIDGWYQQFRSKAAGSAAPASIAVALRKLEHGMFEAVGTGDVRNVLLALGDVELAMGRSVDFTLDSFLKPVPSLSGAWATAVADESVEQRLGAALATRYLFRRRALPLDRTGRAFTRETRAEHVFRERGFVENLHALLLRESVEAMDREPPRGTSPKRCTLSDIAQFIDEQTDDRLIERWARALSLVDGAPPTPLPNDPMLPPASFAVISLVHGRRVGGLQLPMTPAVLARACAGDAEGATTAAIRRLAAVDRPLPVRALVEPSVRMRRIAAALAFPITDGQRRQLEGMVLPRPESTDQPSSNPTQEHA